MQNEKQNYFMETDVSLKIDPDQEVDPVLLRAMRIEKRGMIHMKYEDHPLEAFEQKFVDLFIKGVNFWRSTYDKKEKQRLRSLKHYRKQLRTKICENCTLGVNEPKKYFCGSKEECRVAKFYRSLDEFLKPEDCPYCEDDIDYFDLQDLTIGKKLIRSLKSWKRNRHKWKEKAFAAKRALDAALNIDIEWED